MPPFVATLALAVTLAACGDDGPPPIVDSGTDAAADARVDGAVDSAMPDATPPPPMCGNMLPEAGESCDDGNDVTGDGCTSACTLDPGCGDGTVAAPEVCDDGNHEDGDGCRGDCGSDESCGNGVVDVAASEVCDDGNTEGSDGCSANCRVVEGCGDGSMSATEGCDDGNTTRWDGCGPDCRQERAVVIETFEIDPEEVGCDLNRSGGADNVFAKALGRLRPIQNAQIQTSIEGGALLLLFPFYDLDDPLDDDLFVSSIIAGFDADSDRTNNFGGAGEFFADQRSLQLNRLPLTTFPGRIEGGAFTAGPADLNIVFIISPGFPGTLLMDGSTITGTVRATGGEITAIDDGQLCGALTMNGLARYPNPLQGLPGFESILGCDGQELTSFADLAIGGASALGLSSVRVQPDVDVDRDGLERFEAITTGPAGCQPVVSACIDGDGTRVEGADCDLDPRFADGFSTSISFRAVAAEIVGVAR